MRNEGLDMAAQHATSQWKQKPRPPVLEESHRKVPMKNRINIAIKPTDPDFIKMEQYFDRQLRNDNHRFEDILEDHFTPLEIELFIPGARGPSAKAQEEDITLYQALLAGPFRGKRPTLACKMTMLFFGLPVAPMNLKPFQVPSASDLAAYGDKEQDTIHDPLAFLNEYNGSTPSFTADRKQDTEVVPSLRGGSLGDAEIEVVLSDAERDEEQAGFQLPISLSGGSLSLNALPNRISTISKNIAAPFIHIYGRQGITRVRPSWPHFVEGVVFLLGLRKEQQSSENASVSIAIDLFEDSGSRYLQTYECLLYINPAKHGHESEDKILNYITGNMSHEHYERGRRCFVRLARDRRPSSAIPADSEVSYIKVCRFDLPERPIVYMRITASPSKHNCPSQYWLEFNRAISHLLPRDKKHHYLHLSLKSGPNPVQHFGRIYVGQDLPRGLVDCLPQAIENGSSLSDLQINIQLKPIGCDNIPAFTSMLRDNLPGNELGLTGIVSKSNLTRMNSIADLFVDYCVRADDSRDMVEYVELYLPAQRFFDESIEPVWCYYEHGQAVATEDLWYERINQFSSEDKDIFQEGFAIWGRPVFHEYTLINKFDLQDTAECVSKDHTVKNLLDLDLASFKLIVSTFLFPQRYDVYDQNHILFLSTGYEHDKPEYVIRFDTTEYEWFRIKKRIASNKIQVKIAAEAEKYDLEKGTRWYVDPLSYWGPSHDNPSEGSRLAATNKKVLTQPFAKRGLVMGKKALVSNTKKSQNSAKGKAFGENMREQVKWKVPSVFANPIKPVVPLNGPSIEAFLRAGPRVPMVTLGMRTPTEVAQLEEEVHKLRNLLLNRARECPYSDCSKTFKYHDRDTIDTHLKEDHPVLRCPYCVATGMQGNTTENELYFQNADQAMHHFNRYHWKHMMSQANMGVNGQGLVSSGIPSVVLSNEGRKEILATSKYCNRCGRDHTICHRREDRDNHDQKCYNMSVSKRSMETAGYCVYCGVESHGHGPNAMCVAKNSTLHDPPEICCVNCGISWDGFDKSYQASHKAGCMPLGGKAWDFCGFCGISFAGMEHASKLSHVEFCNERPRPQTVGCPMCLVNGKQKELHSPQQVKSHLENYHRLPTSCLWCDQSFPAHDPIWAECVKIQHFATHMGAVPQVPGINPGAKVSRGHEKCPGFVDCGVIIGQMTSNQFRLHWAQSHDNDSQGQIPYYPNGQIVKRPEGKYNDVKDWHPVFKSQAARQDRQAIQDSLDQVIQYQWSFPNAAIQRPQSPNWEEVLRYSPGEGFIPSENMRCSRCFKPAPSRFDPNYEYEVNLHSDPKYSCRIRRAPGEWKGDHIAIPNRSGWVVFPEGFDFIAVRRSFLDKYPAYQGTVFPYDDERAAVVYNGEQPNRGSNSDDVLSERAPWRHTLPWPPIAGAGEYRNMSDKKSRTIQVPPQREFRDTSIRKTAMRTDTTAHLAAPSHIADFEVPADSEPDRYSSNMAIHVIDANDDVRGVSLTRDLSGSRSEQQMQVSMLKGSNGPAHVEETVNDVPEEESDNGPGEKDGRTQPRSILVEKGKKISSATTEPSEALVLPTTPLKKRGRPQTKKDSAGYIADEQLQPPKRFRRALIDPKDKAPAYGVGEDTGTENADPPKKLARAVPNNRFAESIHTLASDDGQNISTDPAAPSSVIIPRDLATPTRKISRIIRSAKRVTYKDDDELDEIALGGTP